LVSSTGMMPWPLALLAGVTAGDGEDDGEVCAGA
jgi:hypothetical protein